MPNFGEKTKSVMNRTVVVDSVWHFDNLFSSHLQSLQSHLWQIVDLAPVVRKGDSAIYWINHYPADSTIIGFPKLILSIFWTTGALSVTDIASLVWLVCVIKWQWVKLVFLNFTSIPFDLVIKNFWHAIIIIIFNFILHILSWIVSIENFTLKCLQLKFSLSENFPNFLTKYL